MAKYNMWDDTYRRTEDLQEKAIITTMESKDVLENLIIMNSDLNKFDKENLGVAGMKILDMRYNIEDSIEMLNQDIAQFNMILMSLKFMESHVRDNLPEFTVNYNDYKQMLKDREEKLTTIEYTNTPSDDEEEE